MNNRVVCGIVAAGLATLFAPSALDAEQPTSGEVVLDADLNAYSWPHANISPDGQWIAYVSQGFVQICSVHGGPPRRIMEAPHSWTWPHFTIPPKYEPSEGSFYQLTRGLSRDDYRDLLKQVTSEVHGLDWTADSSGIVFGINSRNPADNQSARDAYFTTTAGKLTKLVHVEPDSLTRSVISGTLTADHKFLVSPRGNDRPLIWDVMANKPRATCFLNLIPSSTSGRWLGIEKDTRQLVLVDEDFNIVRRFDQQRPSDDFGFRIDWSPDERFLLWRVQVGFDHFSNWEGFWLDLQTGKKRELTGRFMDELFLFTGRGGEFVACGQTGSKTLGYDVVSGAHLTIFPDDGAAPKDVWRIDVDPNGPMPGALTNRPGNPPLRMASQGELFAIGLPRPAGERSGFVWHLMDRTGKKWQFPGEDNGGYESPCEVVGFASGGQLIVAYEGTRLFTIPVTTIQSAENARP